MKITLTNAQPEIAKNDSMMESQDQVAPPANTDDTPITITPDPIQTIVQQVADDGTITDLTFNAPAPSYQTSLNVEKERLQNMQTKLAADQAAVDADNAAIATQQALVDQISAVVYPTDQTATPAMKIAEIAP